MKMLAAIKVLALLPVFFLGGCACFDGVCQKDPWASTSGVVLPATLEPIVVRVTGYGTYEETKGKVTERQRLMAMRASKLDAFRSLAERVYGTAIYGSSTVKDFVAENDQFRTWVDSYIRGAKIIAVNEMAGGSFETVMELVLEPKFRECLTHTNHFRYTDECRLMLTSGRVRYEGSSKTPGSGAQYYF